MRNIWLIPDREQDGQAYAIDGDRIAPLNEILNLKLLPPELVIGIPEEIIRENHGRNFIFAQLAKLKNDENYSDEWAFCLSSPAGIDKSGRVIFITNLQIISKNEEPTIPPPRPSNFPSDLNILAKQFDDERSSAYYPVKKMINARNENPIAKSFASEMIKKSRFTPDWMPKKNLLLNSLIKKKGDNSYSSIVIVSFLILTVIFIVTLLANAMGHSFILHP